MGWVSYLEDITDRLTDDVGRFHDSLTRADLRSAAEVRHQAEVLLRACETALADIRSHLELATDPHFDMAYEITELNKEKAQLEGEIRTSANDERSSSMKSTDSSPRERTCVRRSAPKANNALKEQDFERLLEASPDAAYESIRPRSTSGTTSRRRDRLSPR